jgi:hypothetical protein
MSPTTRQLEARLARVEKELAELKAALGSRTGAPWYRQIVGAFAGDPAYAEIIRLGRLIRRGRLKGGPPGRPVAAPPPPAPRSALGASPPGGYHPSRR